MKLTKEQQLLVEMNINLVHYVIKRGGIRYKSYNIEYDDLFQIGCLGLIKAAGTYNPEFGAAFSTYAYIVIRNEIVVELVKLNKIPDSIDFSTTEITDLKAETEEGAISNVFGDELMRVVQKAYDEASEAKKRYIDVLLLRVQGFRNTEIAQMVNWKPEYVSKATARAKKYLRNYLETERLLELPA